MVVSRACQVGDLAPAPHDHDSVADLPEVLEVVGHHHDRKSASAEAFDQFEHLARFAHAERRRRLIEKQEFAAPESGARDRHQLALTA